MIDIASNFPLWSERYDREMKDVFEVQDEIARAIAGELGAAFLSIGLADVLDMYYGESERKLHEIFETARRMAPGEKAPAKKRRPAPGAYGSDYQGPRPSGLPPTVAEEPYDA